MDNASDHTAIGRFVNLTPIAQVYKWGGRVRRLLYPPICLFCGGAGADDLDLCAGCHADLHWNRWACHQCALPLPSDTDAKHCGACLRRPPPITRAVAPLTYSPTSRWLITGLKFHQNLGNARLLGELLARHLQTLSDPGPQLVIPVPLHPQRLRERGYNQALEIARPVASRLGLTLEKTAARRIRPTPPQSALDLKSRRRNVRGAFAITRRLDDLHVAIVDDVVTTGHTVHELARVVLAAGAARVDVWSVARAPGVGGR